MRPELTLDALKREAAVFAIQESTHEESNLFGVSDGKAIGTYVEHKFQDMLSASYTFDIGSSAQGIDFPSLNVDMKVTRVNQPQSSTPFKSVDQKIYGLGHSLLVFVYEKFDDVRAQTGRLNILHTIFVDASQTADYRLTKGIREILTKGGNTDDLIAFMVERELPVDEHEARTLA